MPFFAVFVPGHSDSPSSAEIGGGDATATGDSSFVFGEMNKVLETMKKYKDKSPRFKNFPTYEEAVRFAVDGGSDDASSIFGGGGDEERPSTPRPPTPTSTVEELPRPFPAPTRPQLTDLKKAIESKDIVKVRELLEENPRYLINCNGDTPSILQEGFRYNALHVAARAGHLETTQAVLQLFQDETSAYVHRLYPDDRDEETTSIRRRLLLDFYLNTPDKGFNETPLHFAVKNGFVDLVKYLCSFEECDRMLVNKNGQTPKDLATESDRIPGKVKQEILCLLDHRSTEYYVPLYRARDEADAPILRHPTAGFPEKSDKILADYRLAAYIGPVSEEVANQLYSQWAFNSDGKQKSSIPKKKSSKKRSPKSESKTAMNAAAAVKRSDLHKGMERIGRQIADAGNYSWSEYWNFLGVFVDLRMEAGLKQLEQYFSKRATKDQTNFVNAVGSRFAQIDEEQGTDPCRKKLDFGDFNGEGEKDADSSRDSSDLYFDATESEPAGGADTAAKPGKKARSPLNSDQPHEQEESRDGYFTPPQELTANVIVGQEPTKLDRDVFAALENRILAVFPAIDESKFPRTATWMRMIREFPDEERRRWAPLDSPRAATTTGRKKSSLRASD